MLMLKLKLWETQLLKVLLIRAIQAYRQGISPLFPPSCRFYPTCSQYALTAVERFGAMRGLQLAGARILRCHPFHPGGYDPVPEVKNVSHKTIGLMILKPYQQIPIADYQEPLVPIPLESFSVVLPHPYEALGAPYGDKSPYWLRKTVCDRLLMAQKQLQSHHPGWKIQIFDAYRPIAVQEFMVEYSLIQLAQNRGLNPETLTEEQRQTLLEEVYQFWAAPSPDPATPPPHSTGAAVDVTLVDQTGRPIDMGSPIDEISPRSFPDYYAQGETPDKQSYHKHRQLLDRIMEFAGFKRHPREWWHFSHGDQLWVWLKVQEGSWHQSEAIAHYGKAP